jgi:Rv2632c-like
VSDRIPSVVLHVDFDPTPDAVNATVTMDGLGPTCKATGHAPRAVRRPDPEMDYELAMSRALSALEHQLMERVHQRIDRAATDDI